MDFSLTAFKYVQLQFCPLSKRVCKVWCLMLLEGHGGCWRMKYGELR